MANVGSNPAGEGAASDVSGPWSDGMNEHDQLRAVVIENKRLRAALKEIDDHWCGDFHEHVAENALAGKDWLPYEEWKA